MGAVIALVLGSAIGSFLNVVADRLPAGGSLMGPRSACPSCKTTLGTRDLVPILSYLWLRGQCRYCDVPIPRRLFVVELATASLFLAVYWRFGLGSDFLVVAVATVLLFAFAVTDVEHGLVLNRMVVPALFAGLAMAPFWTQAGIDRGFPGDLPEMLEALLNSLAAGGAGFGFFLLIVLLLPAGMGWGDVKLAPVIGLIVGFPGIIFTLWVAIVSGGLVAAVLLATRRKTRKDAIPFAPYLALGAMASLLAGEHVVTWAERLWLGGASLWL